MPTQLCWLLVTKCLRSAAISVLFVDKSRRSSDTHLRILLATIHQPTHFVSDFQTGIRYTVSSVRIIQSDSQQKRQRICKYTAGHRWLPLAQWVIFVFSHFFFSEFSWSGWCTGSCLPFSRLVKHSRTYFCRGSHSITKWKWSSCCMCCRQSPKAARFCTWNSCSRCWTNAKRFIWLFMAFGPAASSTRHTHSLVCILISQEIDEYINQAKDKGYAAVLELGTKGVSVIMQTALKVSQVSTFCPCLTTSSLCTIIINSFPSGKGFLLWINLHAIPIHQDSQLFAHFCMIHLEFPLLFLIDLFSNFLLGDFALNMRLVCFMEKSKNYVQSNIVAQLAPSLAERPTVSRDVVDRPSVAREVREDSVLDDEDSDESYINPANIIGLQDSSASDHSENSGSSEDSVDDDEYVPGPTRRTTRQTAKKTVATKAAKTTAAKSNGVTARKPRATRSVSVRWYDCISLPPKLNVRFPALKILILSSNQVQAPILLFWK